VCTALLALLLANVALSSFPRVSGAASTVSSNGQHNPKPCLDQVELYGCVAIAAFFPVIPLAFSPAMLASEPILSLDASGNHYTRPPPLN
jgi:hypothetical protein